MYEHTSQNTPEKEPSKYENGSSYPRTLEDFKTRAAELEQQRETMRAIFIDAGHVPEDVPQFAHLTGQLAAVHQQIFAMNVEEIEKQFNQ